mmetsp:Transcript_2508/g.8545  ORF Transcript_2508/g.8545 Transcript_2508/m.8545 type:complete len:235 (+) Transcript_2508:779-1483(+)
MTAKVLLEHEPTITHVLGEGTSAHFLVEPHKGLSELVPVVDFHDMPRAGTLHGLQDTREADPRDIRGENSVHVLGCANLGPGEAHAGHAGSAAALAEQGLVAEAAHVLQGRARDTQALAEERRQLHTKLVVGHDTVDSAPRGALEPGLQSLPGILSTGAAALPLDPGVVADNVPGPGGALEVRRGHQHADAGEVLQPLQHNAAPLGAWQHNEQARPRRVLAHRRGELLRPSCGE